MLKDEPKPVFYYLQNLERGTVGNSVLWWTWNNRGYTCDVRYAKKFTPMEADELCETRKKFRKWNTEFVDRLVQHHIDHQDLFADPERMEPHTTTSWGYADRTLVKELGGEGA